MARRNLIHLNHLKSLDAWMADRGYVSVPTKGAYEFRRYINAALEGPQRTVLLFRKNMAPEHLSIQDKDLGLMNQFMSSLPRQGSLL